MARSAEVPEQKHLAQPPYIWFRNLVHLRNDEARSILANPPTNFWRNPLEPFSLIPKHLNFRRVSGQQQQDNTSGVATRGVARGMIHVDGDGFG